LDKSPDSDPFEFDDANPPSLDPVDLDDPTLDLVELDNAGFAKGTVSFLPAFGIGPPGLTDDPCLIEFPFPNISFELMENKLFASLPEDLACGLFDFLVDDDSATCTRGPLPKEEDAAGELDPILKPFLSPKLKLKFVIPGLFFNFLLS
jgi:hypothetical protein